MAKLFLFLILLASISSNVVMACERLDSKNPAHVQTWLTLLVTRDVDKTPFLQVGKVKVSSLSAFKQFQPLDHEIPEVQDAITQLAGNMHKYLATKWNLQTPEDIARVIENELRADGTICDLANEMEQAVDFKSARLKK